MNLKNILVLLLIFLSFTEIVQAEFIPPTPQNLNYTNDSIWINYTWSLGTSLLFIPSSIVEVANISTSSADLTSVVYGNDIYTFGGYLTSSAISTNRTYSYNTTTNTWTPKTNMITKRWGMIAALINDTAYVFGGNTDATTPSVKNEMYNITNNTWSTKNNTPVVIGHQGINGIAYNNNVYLFYKNFTYVYYPINDTYLKLSDNPQNANVWSQIGEVNNKLYIIGGYNTTTGLSSTSVSEYDPNNDTWVTKTSSPRAIFGAVRENIVYNNEIYLAFGQKNTGGYFFSTIYIYNPITDTWKGDAIGTHTRDGVAGGFVNGEMYIIGGRDVAVSPYGVGWNEKYTPYNSINGTQNSTNIAIGKTAFADVEFSGTYAAGKAIDGNLDTFWVTPDLPSYPVNWTIDLGNNYTLYNISAYQSGLADYLVNEYAIYTSYDNISYSLYIPKSQSSSDTIRGKIFSWENVFTTRYIRIQVISKTGSFGSGISEFNAYIADSTELENTTDSYNIKYNNIWYNGTTDKNLNTSIIYDQWNNITILAYNTSGIGSLSLNSISNSIFFESLIEPISDPPTSTDRLLICNSTRAYSDIIIPLFGLALMILGLGTIFITLKSSFNEGTTVSGVVIISSILLTIVGFGLIIVGNYLLYAIYGVTC